MAPQTRPPSLAQNKQALQQLAHKTTVSGSITTGTGAYYAHGIYNIGSTTRPPSLAALRQRVFSQTAFATVATTTRPPSLAALRQG